MFTRDEVHWFSETVRALYASRTTSEFVGAAGASVYERFRLCSSSYEELSVDLSSYVLYGCRSEVPVPPDHAANFHDCPFAPLLHQEMIQPVWHMRQHVSFATWARTDHFNGIARPMGWCDHICLVRQFQDTVFMVGLQRDTTFSAKECELLRMLQPHVAAAWIRVRPQETVRESAPLRIALSPTLRPYGLSAAQCFVLRSYFPAWRRGAALPVELQTWVTGTLRQLRLEPPPHPLHAFAVESARGRLLVRCFPNANGGPVQLVMVETPANPDYFRLRAAGLTSRECEVLHWIAQGKRDAEIAIVLGCAPATVSKHVEHLLAKLGAANRTAALGAAVRLLQAAA